MTRIAILDYGMGNLRSVEKALEKVGAEAEITADRERVESADGVILPGVGAFPKAMGRVHEIGLDELVAGRVEAGVPVLGICLGMQLLFDSSVENEGASGLALLGGVVAPLGGQRLQGPAHRLVAGALGARLAAHRGPRGGDALLLRPLVRAAPLGRATTCSAPPPTASASPARSSARRSTASSSTPRSRAPRGSACSANFIRICS